jgi:AcrR family transcriptional regulator
MAADGTNPTRERLLETAGKLFAQKGLKATTVREICEEADANIAAVNYHFGGKQKLFNEVLSSIIDQAMSRYPPDLGQDEAHTPQERLYAFVHAFLQRILDPDRPAWQRRLLAQQMSSPSEAAKNAILRHVHRAHDLLGGILAELTGLKAGSEALELCTASIAAQCLFYHRRRHMVGPVFRVVKLTPGGIERLARHITDFSLEGLRGMEVTR